MSATRRQWEYRTTRDPDPATLDALGHDGWELVGVAADGTCYLKRPALDFKERVTLDQKRRYYALWSRAIPEDETAGRA